MIGGAPSNLAELAAAARAELQLRADKYPLAIANGRLDEAEGTIDWQAWHLIARWLETGHFRSLIAGGADGDTFVSWAECDTAAARALAKLREQVQAATPDKAAAQRKRLANLSAIARLVSRERSFIDSVNQALRDRALQGRKAA